MRRFMIVLLAAAAPAAMAGCVGGGGYSPYDPHVPPDPKAPSFTSFSEIEADSRTTVSGWAAETVYEYDPEAGEGVDPMEIGEFSVESASVEIEADSAGAIAGLTVFGPETSRTWQGGTLSQDADGYLRGHSDGVDGGHSVIASAHEYQAFGAWATGVDDAEGGSVGAFSVGTRTDVHRIPQAGGAVFTGAAAAAHVDGGGQHSHVTAAARLEADFSNRRVHFATTDSVIEGSGGTTAASHLDVDGVMTYGHGGWMTGEAVSGDGMEGFVAGRFYGPAAEEIGGTFSLSGGGSAMTGAYGAAR